MPGTKPDKPIPQSAPVPHRLQATDTWVIALATRYSHGPVHCSRRVRVIGDPSDGIRSSEKNEPGHAASRSDPGLLGRRGRLDHARGCLKVAYPILDGHGRLGSRIGARTSSGTTLSPCPSSCRSYRPGLHRGRAHTPARFPVQPAAHQPAPAVGFGARHRPRRRGGRSRGHRGYDLARGPGPGHHRGRRPDAVAVAAVTAGSVSCAGSSPSWKVRAWSTTSPPWWLTRWRLRPP